MARFNYSITFMSLRGGTTYVLTIGGGSGAAIPLKGGAQPFTTQEDDSDDMFQPIRTQSGYLRIVDDGFDARTPAQAFDWKDLLPSTDTERPVTLTAGGTVLWQGFMQAQNFGGVLYGNPQEREFPVQCVLTVTEGTDINYDQTKVRNFAYLLLQIINSIPSGQRPTNIVIQGGSDARDWLLKQIDWQNFSEENNDGVLVARFNMFQCLEDMCRFWGWTARTCGSSLYMTCADDYVFTDFLTLSYSDLTTLADGTSAGSVGGSFLTVTPGNNSFASTSQETYLQRGSNKATVSATSNTIDKVISYAPDSLIKDMAQYSTYNEVFGNMIVNYSNDKVRFNSSFLSGSAVSSKGSFNLMTAIARQAGVASLSESEIPVFRLKSAYDSANTNPYVSLETKYEHVYYYGQFRLIANFFRHGEKFQDYGGEFNPIGNKTMFIAFGIGPTRSTAKWYNGNSWVTFYQMFEVTIGNNGNTLYIKYNNGHRSSINMDSQTSAKGKLFVDFYGSSDFPSDDLPFEISGFEVSFDKANANYRLVNADGNQKAKDVRYYQSTNANNVRNEWNTDCIYASDNLMFFGTGLISNPNNTYFFQHSYNGSDEYPEQHLADRVTTYWSVARQKFENELMSNIVGDVTPQYFINMDGMNCYPIAISHEWRDDITQFVMLETPLE